MHLGSIFRPEVLRPFGSAHIETAESTPSNRFGNGVSATFTISSITTLMMVHLCWPCASIPSRWADVTSTYPHCSTASHLSLLTGHFVVGISRMEVIAHLRTSNNDRRSHPDDTCNPILYGLNYYCPSWTSCVFIFVVCRPTFILAQEFLISKDLPSTCRAGGLFLL